MREKKIDFWGIATSYPEGCTGAVAEISLAPERIAKLVDSIRITRETGSAAVAHMQQLAGKISFAESSIMGRLGKPAMRET